MTEDEAKTKSCPKTLESYEGLGSFASTIGSPCIASECMAWRWINPDNEAPEGFCGLAGRS